MTGGQLQEAIIEMAHAFEWRVAHFRPALTKHGWRTPVSADGKGFPDLLLVHPERKLVLYREIKTKYEKLSPEQAEWGAWLLAAGQDYAVYRPDDWPTIVNVLTFGRGSPQ
jgi:hypothetical protein